MLARRCTGRRRTAGAVAWGRTRVGRVKALAMLLAPIRYRLETIMLNLSIVARNTSRRFGAQNFRN